MELLNLLKWFLLAGAGAAFPAVVLNVSRRMLPPVAIAGGMGFLVQQPTTPAGGIPGYLQVFLGAVMVGLLSEAFARRWRTPALTFLIPGIFPLVPGGISAYRTVQLLVAEQWQEAAAAGLTTAAASFAIAFGLMLVAAFFRGLSRHAQRTPPPSGGITP